VPNEKVRLTTKITKVSESDISPAKVQRRQVRKEFISQLGVFAGELPTIRFLSTLAILSSMQLPHCTLIPSFP